MIHKTVFNYPKANEEVLDIVAYENVRESHVVSSDMQESSHLPIIFRYVYHNAFWGYLCPVEKFTNWEGFPGKLT